MVPSLEVTQIYHCVIAIEAVMCVQLPRGKENH